LRDHPSLVKAFMGIDADQFWEMIQQMNHHFAHHLKQQRHRTDRRLAVGGGRSYDLSLAIRTALVLTYLRLHIPQTTVAASFGATQSDVSRELRRLLPLIQHVLLCPLLRDVQDTDAAVPVEQQLKLTDLAEGRVLVDATEQRVSRPHQCSAQKAYYSGKKKAFTLKTQVVGDGAHYVHDMRPVQRC
jgi:hypothetical protein